MAWLHVEYAPGDEEPTWSWSTFASCIEDTLLSWPTLCDRNVILTIWFHQWLFSLREKKTEQYTRPTCATWMFYFGGCFVALSVFLHLWIGPVHGMKSCMIGTVESMNLRPFMASSDGQNDVSSHMWIRGGGPTHFWHTVFTNVCRWKGLQHSVWSQKLTNAEWKCCLVSFIA